MDFVYPVDSCLNPVRLPSPDGGVQFFPCGRCKACRHSFQSTWRNRLLHHIQSKYITTVFITLTYSNDHLPLVHLDPETMYVNDVTYTYFKRGLSGDSFVRDSCIGYFEERDPLFRHSFSRLKSSDIPHWVLSRHNNSFTYDSTPSFAVCLRKDVQDFVKRLRVRLSRADELRDFDTSFTYFICSEYGPKTFRPHYHGLLFFNSQKVAEFCDHEFVLDCWKKCDLSGYSSSERKCAQLVSSPEGSAKYISKYVTCNSVLPSFLSSSLTAPFHLQSKTVPIGSIPFDFDIALDKIHSGDILSHRSFIDPVSKEIKIISLPYPDSCWRRFFPRFVFDGLLTPYIKKAFFSRLFDFRDIESFDDVPNYINEVASKFHVGEIVHSSSKSHTLCCPFSVGTRLRYIPTNPDLIWRTLGVFRDSDYLNIGYGPSDVVSRVTYSSIITDLLNDEHSMDYYLFGIPQNRSASLKIIRFLKSDGRNIMFDDYFRLYHNFYSLVASSSMSRSFEYESVLSTISSPCPEYVAELYPSFYYSLPKELDAFTSEDYDVKDTIVHYRFGLDLCEFYDSDGFLKPLDSNLYGFKSLYLKYIDLSNMKTECSRAYQHTLLNEL